jgi:ribosomal protein S18 acetylase RimI-like enzyme
VIYRPYEEADFAALYAIEEACFEPLFRFPRRYMRHLLQRANAAAWIALTGEGEMAGFAIAGWSSHGDVCLAYIETIEVLAEARGQGAGGELLRRIEGSALRAGAAAIWLHVDAENAAAIQLYERHGYHPAGREEKFYPQGRAALIYRKELQAS